MGKTPQASMTVAEQPLAKPKEFSPRELATLLKREFPRLHAEFAPSEAQIRNHLNLYQDDQQLSSPVPSSEVAEAGNKQISFGFCEGNSESPGQLQSSDEKLHLQSSDSENPESDRCDERASAEKVSSDEEEL